MSKKEEKAREYTENILSPYYPMVDSYFNSYELEDAFETGWDAVIKEIKADIEWRRNKSTWAEYNEALDDISSFIDSLKS